MRQSKRDNPEKLLTFGIQDDETHDKNITQPMLDITIRKQTHNVNKTCSLLQTTGGKEHRFHTEIVTDITTGDFRT
jgi:hypothetical protein